MHRSHQSLPLSNLCFEEPNKDIKDLKETQLVNFESPGPAIRNFNLDCNLLKEIFTICYKHIERENFDNIHNMDNLTLDMVTLTSQKSKLIKTAD
jgi:hypothetical protein